MAIRRIEIEQDDKKGGIVLFLEGGKRVSLPGDLIKNAAIINNCSPEVVLARVIIHALSGDITGERGGTLLELLNIESIKRGAM